MSHAVEGLSMHITPEVMEAVYRTLAITPPFRGWKLPHADDVGFHVLRTKNICGDHFLDKNRRHHIRISHKKHSTLRSLTETIAHEMVHMREHELGVSQHIAHGTVFHRLADQVCRHHGFDRGAF